MEAESSHPAAEASARDLSDAAGSTFIGNSATKIFHLANCRTIKEMADSNRTWHETIEKAERRGYRPCKVCKPTESDMAAPD